MKQLKTYFLTLTALASTTTLSAQSQKQLFDFGWKFTHNGTTQLVDLPHDWDILEGPHSGKGVTGTGGGWFEAGKGEYRKLFASPKGEVVKLHFEGVYQKSEIFVNGQKVGQHHYGYTPFTVDITKMLKNKGMNEVVVKVDNSQQPNCRWYSGSGIYRHVWLESMPALHIAENGVFVTTPEVSDNQALVQVEVSVANESPSNRNAIITIGGKELTVNLTAGETQTVRTQFTVNNPSLWSTEHPTLNNLSVQLKEKGKILDTQTVKYGIRSFSFDAEKGFILNGKKVLINGACVHHDDGVLGASAFDDAEIRKVRQMKNAGFNLIRTSHNPTTRAFLDACDSIGMLVIDEAFDGWRTQKNPYDYSTVIDSCFRSDIQSMVLRDRNHPSIISWSIGNEVIERKDIRVVYTARQMKAAIHEKDTTRPVTEALCAWDSDWEIYDPHAEVLDVVGYNYMLFKHADDHKRDPKRVIWQTESYPRDAFRNWATVHDFPYVVGDIVWTGLDYLGESGIGRTYYKGEREGESWIKGGQPEWHGAPCGDVDITGCRKPISHYREMLWNENTPLYMAVKEPEGYHGEIKQTMWSVWPTYESWTWKGWEGKPVEVEVYTHQPKVKLYLNDQLIGTKEVNRNTEYKAVFTVPYQKGTLRAEAGEESVTLKTAGEPARLKLTPDRTVMRADGQSLTYIIVEVVDQDGNLVPEAEIPCEATVKGAGKLLAFASANLKDEEPYPSVHSKTWKGRAMLVVRSSQKKGTVNVSIKSKLPIATLSLKTK
ncbi:glycoside hydrolase family 2 TIM barrel-domain containing protein [Segatella bryantii]|uniref:glycoside hydrolase family 2 TIM barrel-domain containing protein n=1 Tax=Segatella bryantii TaxID=77095 RepID=UPI00285352BD|nr:glycoside hydrolase family 2 TIM barrel-domain containing protein [Segatella bryantii]MDR4931660.1 glycoside hydrolase family 2 TIM barrel-domain containing protein [Segatella bryantii]